MDCERCGTSLSIQDLEKNEWFNDSEIFFIKCPLCEHEIRLISSLFEEEHINKQYLKMIVLDSFSNKKEKYVDYIPKKQRDILFEHLSSCYKCSQDIEGMRLTEVDREIEFNKATYKFFIDKSKDTMIELDTKDMTLEGSVLKSFVFDNKVYEVCEDNLFFSNNEVLENVKVKRECYNLDNGELVIGMVSFVFSKNKVILEKIWLKTEQQIEKEKMFLSNMRRGKIRILFELFQKHFV